MTIAARPDRGQRLLHLLASCDQLSEWNQRIELLREGGRRLAVAYGPDRRAEAEELASAFSAPAAPLSAAHRLEPHLYRDDLLVAVTSAGGGRPSLQSIGGLSTLHGLLHGGVVIWGITGPRPNPVSPYCHDSLAVPESDPSLLLRGHRLVVRQLAVAAFTPTRLVAARVEERSR